MLFNDCYIYLKKRTGKQLFFMCVLRFLIKIFSFVIRRPPSSGMGSSGAVHTLGLPTPLSAGMGSLTGLNSYAMTTGNNLAASMGCSGMGSLGGLNSLGATGSSSSAASGLLSTTRGRQRNSVAVVDSRDHIYEELDISRGPPKLTPVSGVLPQVCIVVISRQRKSTI